MQPLSSNNRRAHYRLRYPRTERPLMRIGDRDYVVTELSEGGARVLLGADAGCGQSVAGALHFKDGGRAEVSGAVLRVEGKEAVVRFSRGVTFKRMLDEQIRVKRAYPQYFDRLE